jgi:hypothetical protein
MTTHVGPCEGCDLGGRFTDCALAFAAALSFTTVHSLQRRSDLATEEGRYRYIDALSNHTVYREDFDPP